MSRDQLSSMRHCCNPLVTPPCFTSAQDVNRRLFPEPFNTFKYRIKTDISVCIQHYSLPLPYPVTCSPEAPFTAHPAGAFPALEVA